MMKRSFWYLVGTIVVVMFLGGLGMGLSGFAFADDAADLFLTKLPVFLLVALLIERTAEIFLTIWRGTDSVSKERELETLTTLNKKKMEREGRLAELTAELAECEKIVDDLKNKPTETEELKVREAQATKLRQEKAELEEAKRKEDPVIASLESAKLENGETGTVKNRTKELTDYKSKTRSLAFSFNFILALCIATCGFRAIEGLVVLRPTEDDAAASVPSFDQTRLEALTVSLTKQIAADRTELEKVKQEERTKTKQEQDKKLAAWLKKDLQDVVVDDAVKRQILFFRFFDILLTAGLLAGGADPISRIMKLLRDFLDQTSKQANKQDS